MKRQFVVPVAACVAAAAAAGLIAATTMGNDVIAALSIGNEPARAATSPTNVVMAQSPKAAQPAPAAQSAQPAAPSAPRRTETINYDSWVVTCTDTVEKGSSKACNGVLRVIDSKSGQALFAWVIARDNEGALRTVLNTPTGVLVQKGVELKFGASQPGVVPYVACTPQQCEASIVMVDAMLRDARANEKATATIRAVDGRNINFEMSIKGIDKVLAAIGAK